MERIFARIAWFIGLALVQVLIFNKVCLFGVATPFVYVYFILLLDRDVNRNALMLMAFALGLVIDVFNNTPGVNASASVLVAFLRPGLLQLFAPRDEFDSFEPGIHVMGIWPYVRYALLVVLLHHTALFILEAFSFVCIEFLLLRILCSTLLTVMLLMAVEFIRHKR